MSTRYVDADSAGHAVETVRELLLAALDIRATSAGTMLQRGYDAAGPTQRRRILDELDTLAPPTSIRSARKARRRLAREVRFDIQRRAWVRNQLGATPPVAPEAADDVLRRVELARLGEPADLQDALGDGDRALEA